MKTLSEIAKEIKERITFPDLFRELYPEQYKQHGNSICPFHEDTNASFAVNKAYGKCHAGCTPPGGKAKSYDVIALYRAKHGCNFKTSVEVLAGQCGVKLPKGKARARSDELGEPLVTYEYCELDGNVVHRSARHDTYADGSPILDKDGNPDKTFRQSRPDGNGGWIDDLKGVRLVLFGLPELLKAAPDEPILFVEGEKDVLTARRLKFVATCNPMGAGKWASQCKDHDIQAPSKGRIVWVIPDNNEPGGKHADEVARSLRWYARSVKILGLPGLPGKGDLSDFVEANGDYELARELIVDLAAKTPEYRPAWTGPSLVSLHDLMEMDLPEPEWIIPSLIVEGLTVFAGPPKIGESYFIHGASLSVASGKLFLGQFQCSQGGVLHLALGDNLRRLRWRTSRMLKDRSAPKSAYFACQWPHFSDNKQELDGLDFIQRWIEEHHDTARMVVIDTFAKIRPRKKFKSDIYERDYADLEGLQLLAGKYRIAVVVVHHLNKGTHADIYNSGSGSSGITGAADTVMILEKTQRIEAEGTLFISGRDVEDRKGAVIFDRDTGLWKWLGDAADVKTTNERREIREILRYTGRPMKPAEIADLMEPKKSADAIRKTLVRMTGAGEAARAAGGYGKYTLPLEDAPYSPNEVHVDYL